MKSKTINYFYNFFKGPPIGTKLRCAVASLRAPEVDQQALRRAEVLFSNPPAAGGAGVLFSTTPKDCIFKPTLTLNFYNYLLCVANHNVFTDVNI